jgi:hypothetical protein
MGRISLGDVLFGGLVTLLIAAAIVFTVGFIASAVFAVSDALFDVVAASLVGFFLVAGPVLAVLGRRAGYPVLTTWAWGALVIVLIVSCLLFVGVVVLGGDLTAHLVGVILSEVGALVLGLFFAVSLASFLNSRSIGLSQAKTHGSVSGQFGATIYRSNQPAIFEGISELDLSVEAPGSLYRGKQ